MRNHCNTMKSVMKRIIKKYASHFDKLRPTMKKLMLLFSWISLIPTAGIAQEEREPTIKETFDFIVHIIEHKVVTSDVSPYKTGLKNVRSDYENLSISFEDSKTLFRETPSEHKQTIKYTVCLKDIIGTEIRALKNILPKYHPWFEGKWSTDFTLKSNGIVKHYFEDNQWKIVKFNEFGFHFPEDKKDEAIKLEKAFKHLIKLTTGFKANLFDD
jgi:hypothetical protein